VDFQLFYRGTVDISEKGCSRNTLVLMTFIANALRWKSGTTRSVSVRDLCGVLRDLSVVNVGGLLQMAQMKDKVHRERDERLKCAEQLSKDHQTVDGRLQLGVEVEQQVNIQGTLNMRSGIIQ
jgi:hypothetical protein